ncbi:MAG: HEAT repeat domain-containing protein [Deltaproteobacteria bacterium]|nr:HEAT repeat domain-containing protein [Deltaproteobacteria bacterium]
MRHRNIASAVILVIFAAAACQHPSPVNDLPPKPRAVGDLDPVEMVRALEYPDDDRDVQRRFAAIMVGLMRELSAIELLNEKVVIDRSPRVRAAAAFALGEMKDFTSIEPLVNATHDRVGAVRIAAIHALGQFEDPAAEDRLKEMAKDHGPEALAAVRAIAERNSVARQDMLKGLSLDDPRRFMESGEPYAPESGRAWYVDATDGDDEGEGSKASPFKTLNRAIKELRGGAGDRLFATSGRDETPFRESVTLPFEMSGTRNAPTVLSAWPDRPPPVLDGASPEKPDEPAEEDGIHLDADFVQVDGFVVRRFRDSGIDLNGVTGCVISNCVVELCDRHGIFLYYAPDNALIDPTVRKCNYQGISIRSSPRALVLGGLSERNGIDGLLFLWDSDDGVVDGFTARGNQRGLGLIQGSNDLRVFRSVLEGNKEADLSLEPDSSVQVVASKVVKTQ